MMDNEKIFSTSTKTFDETLNLKFREEQAIRNNLFLPTINHRKRSSRKKEADKKQSEDKKHEDKKPENKTPDDKNPEDKKAGEND